MSENAEAILRLKEMLYIQTTFTTADYEKRIIMLTRAKYGINHVSGDDIIRQLWIAHSKWQFYPDKMWRLKIPHHKTTDEPTDDWFLSRIADVFIHTTRRK
ncbi:MAG: hypothetical protein IT393_07185 [Nitrospirae bacterium]|nr:hypothetical protein [Nitrospirota bacterium]